MTLIVSQGMYILKTQKKMIPVSSLSLSLYVIVCQFFERYLIVSLFRFCSFCVSLLLSEISIPPPQKKTALIACSLFPLSLSSSCFCQEFQFASLGMISVTQPASQSVILSASLSLL